MLNMWKRGADLDVEICRYTIYEPPHMPLMMCDLLNAVYTIHHTIDYKDSKG